MPHPLDALINEKLQKAKEEGAFDNLPGQGRPIDHGHSPKDALLNRLMVEAKAKPPVVVLSAQITASTARLKILTDPDERKAEMTVLANLQTRLAIEKELYQRFG